MAGTFGQQISGLFFDPAGADFTEWINRFKNEVYRNWILPQPALMGFKGHVAFEFTVERDGSRGRHDPARAETLLEEATRW